MEQVQAEVEEERKKLVAAEKERLKSEQEDRMLLEQRAKDAASQQRLKELEARVSLARGKGDFVRGGRVGGKRSYQRSLRCLRTIHARGVGNMDVA